MRLFATALISLALPTFALDPAMFNLVSPGATALAGVDVVRVQASPQGQFLMTELNKKANDWDKVAAAVGFDPRRDLREVLVATSGPAAGPQQSLLVARGVFDQQRLLSLSAAAGYASSVYKGTTIVTLPQHSGTDTVAFVAGYLVGGARSEVEAAVDRSNARTASGPLTARALLASTRYDAWVVTATAGDLAQAIPGGSQGIPLRGINSVLGGVQFGSQMEIGVEAEAKTAQDASSLADVIRLGAAMAQTNQNTSQIGSILNSLSVSTEGTTVRAALKVSEADFEKFFNQVAPAQATGRRIASR